MQQVFNFSAGPAMLPADVLQIAQKELLNWHDLGTSVMEISHRSKQFMAVAAQAEQDLRDLLAIPDNYKVLFCQGGARAQFAAVPLNLLGIIPAPIIWMVVTGRTVPSKKPVNTASRM